MISSSSFTLQPSPPASQFHRNPILVSISRHRTTFAAYSSSLASQRTSVEKLACENKLPENDEIQENKEGKRKKEVSGIYVPRQKYIDVSKVELLDSVLSLFEDDKDAKEFRLFSSFLDAILHAEHKVTLEEMRGCYSAIRPREEKTETNKADECVNSSGDRGSSHFASAEEDGNSMNGFSLRSVLDYYSRMAAAANASKSRIATATQFQRSFMKLLQDAQFEELSAQDLLLTYALNNDYLLTLPIYVDWKRASESNAIIFRRGYATERQKGVLIVEKLDYLQSRLLQKVFFALSEPLKNIGNWLNEALRTSKKAQDIGIWFEKVKMWLRDQYSAETLLSSYDGGWNNQMDTKLIAESDLPIWLAAQKAISRYEGLLSPIGPRWRLLRRMLTWLGIIPTVPDTSAGGSNEIKYLETYMSPNFLPRRTLSNVWEPASGESCNYDVWKMMQVAVSILFSKSTLQEPAFQELILLYTDSGGQAKNEDREDILPLQLKIYENIPIPDLPVIFPHKKLSFRILDTVRLDVASILGLLAFFINYRFENILSSPSAILLDVIAISALVIYASRVVLGYKQTWDRYQLLVNRTLYEKTLASGFGSVHFLLDASEQQKFKEAILVYAILLNPGLYQVSCRETIKEACERFIFDHFKEKIEMPINEAIDTMMRLGILFELHTGKKTVLKVLPCLLASETLRRLWNDLLKQTA